MLGALTLERPVGEEFDHRTIELCEHVALLIGPVLDVKRKEDRWLIQKAADSMETHLRSRVNHRTHRTAIRTIIGRIHDNSPPASRRSGCVPSTECSS